ncbi:MAG: 2-oxoglutarate dehydrogenase E1 component [Microscillaceae bacterium]|nr:2-oxoglutarate dehydrogenase E1 component [Microscillaceae bacterium]
MDKYSYIANADPSYIDQLYQAFKENPDSVDLSWQRFFEGFEFSQTFYSENGASQPLYQNGSPNLSTDPKTPDQLKEIKCRNLVFAYRGRGHLKAKTNPVRERRDRRARLELEDFFLSDADLDMTFQSGISLFQRPATLREIVERAKYIYTGPIGFEFMYIREPEIIAWFKSKIEREDVTFVPSEPEQQRILAKLNEANVFENFLHTKYVGQKRFSLEGGENTIPALDAIINRSAELGVEEVFIAMAHRGRLNVLVNILGKTYEDVFNEFEGINPEDIDLNIGDGDVKYHMGYSGKITTPSGKTVNIQLAPNPSHLETVNAVISGYARANCDDTYHGNADKILPIMIHGDAAVAGQGIVYELIQMSKLPGYYTGGTIHFVINNQIGFTTDFEDARSSIYCTDIAKITDSPVLHVNGDDAEAVNYCCKLAAEFREKFNRDIFIDMVCYRKYGHNESDEPRFTQPKLYDVIAKHPSPREIYMQRLAERGGDLDLVRKMEDDFRKMLQDRLNMVKQKSVPYKLQKLEEEWQHLTKSQPTDFDKSPETGISKKDLDQIAQALCSVPEGFKPLKQIERLLKQRQQMFFEDKQLDWAAAELLAYGSCLIEGKIVRMSGQDVERGTFSHRHAVLTDANTNEPYVNLDYIQENQERFRIYNSLLSEYAVLGFEFGYAMANPNALVIWEAQFGDFVNGAQIMIDQFISSSESKWNRMNGIVLLLPHGYEGQGPEHSSARPERFLQMSAEYNMIVANITTPANFFHLLRRQLAWNFRKPLIVMSPKSLLRKKEVISPLKEFTKGSFQEVIGDNYVDPKKVERILLCSGKVYYDLLEKQQKDKRKDVAIIRIEQLHPFPSKRVHMEIGQYPNAKVHWVQEEPVNMGAWTYIQRVYKYDQIAIVARKSSASPATGFPKIHAEEQEYIVNASFM